MNIAQSLMAGAGRSDPLMRPGGTTELRGMLLRQASLWDDARELQVPSDESLGYSHIAPLGRER